MVLISGICNRADVREMLYVWLFFAGGIIVPGTAVFSIVGIKGSTRLEALLFSFTIGYIISFGIYFLMSFIKLDFDVKIVYIILFFVSLIIIFTGKHKNSPDEIGGGKTREPHG